MVFRYSLLFMLGTESGEELVATAGSIDVRPISMIILQRSLGNPDSYSNRMD